MGYNAKLEIKKRNLQVTRNKKEIRSMSSERESKPNEPEEYQARHMLEARW